LSSALQVVMENYDPTFAKQLQPGRALRL
jgi:hypothetical protein